MSSLRTLDVHRGTARTEHRDALTTAATVCKKK